MSNLLRLLFFAVVIRPLFLVILGSNVRHRERLPKDGPAVIVANHNSHLDTMLLITLFPLRQLARVRPVAAADYFLRNRWLAWFSMRIIGIVPLERHASRRERCDPLQPIDDALERGEILILFPEGSRGEPEQASEMKTGIAHVAKRHPDLAIHPIFMHGLGKALPRGEGLLVPFFCDVFCGEPIAWTGDKTSFMETLACQMKDLAEEGQFPEWE